MTGRDILCFSTQDWNDLWTRKQRFMKMFAEAGNRVLYIETPVHLFGLDVLPGDPSRFYRFLSGPRKISERLHAATLPILLPFFQMSHIINQANHIWIKRLVRQWIEKLGFRNPLLWIYTPFSAPVLEEFEHDAVYECVDEFRAARGFISSKVIGEMEDRLLRKVRMTIVTHENLMPQRERLCPNTFCIPNAADVSRFRDAAFGRLQVPEDIAKISCPRVGFVGYIQYWIDLDLIGFMARQRPGWSFVLIGPTAPLAKLEAIKPYRNVYLLGRKPENTIPAYLQAFDCCINPYVTGTLADHCSPLKLYEYLAAGKPVISTDMPEARKFGGEVDVACSYEEFLQQCSARIAELPQSESAVERRLKIAAPHSWESRFGQLNKLLGEVFQPVAKTV
jgi:glycosyltransferase involved in cell wall biosynthesis